MYKHTMEKVLKRTNRYMNKYIGGSSKKETGTCANTHGESSKKDKQIHVQTEWRKF
jgi:hypothetical protein